MHLRRRPLAALLGGALLLPPLVGQAAQTPAVVTQQEQNALRAEAFRAENEARYGDAADAFLKLSRTAPTRIMRVISSVAGSS